MKSILRSLWPVLLLIAFSAKAFVPIGMMLDVKSFVRGGDLVTICPSVGELPWMTAFTDHSGHHMAGVDENADARCPYAALDAPTAFDAPDILVIFHSQIYQLTVSPSDQYRSIVLKRAARAPPVV